MWQERLNQIEHKRRHEDMRNFDAMYNRRKRSERRSTVWGCFILFMVCILFFGMITGICFIIYGIYHG